MAVLPRTKWIQSIAGFVIGILLIVLPAYAIFSFYTWFYACDCGYDSSLSGSAVVQSNDQIWKDFVKCKIKLGQGLTYKITYSSGVKAMDGKKISISGFIQPLEAKGASRHFLLCKNAPSCAYCPPSKPNEIVEVFSAKPMPWKQNLQSISGTLHLVSDGNNGVFFQLRDAV